MVLCFYTPLPHVFNSYLPIWLYMAKQASWTHSICFIPHVASSRNPHDILFFLSKQEQAGYSAIFLCKAEKGRSRPHRPCAQTVIWCYTDYRWHSQQLVFTPKSSLWSTAKAQALLPPHIFIALRAAFCLSESVPEVKCKFIIIYSLCNILLQYLYRLRWPAHYVVGVLLSSFDVNGNHSICSSWEECDCEVGKETIVKWTDGHYANLV